MSHEHAHGEESHEHAGGDERHAHREEDGVLPAVDHPVDKIYEDPRQFVRELSTTRYDYADVWEDLRDPDRRVIKGKDIPLKSKTDLVEGSQAWGKSYVRPWKGITQSLSMHMIELAPESGAKEHGHQNEAMLYILEGEGYEVHDGVEYPWEAGNLVVIHGGCVHRHYSADPEEPCRGLIVKPKALYQFLHLLYQGTTERPPTDPVGVDPEWTPSEDYSEEDEHGKGGR